MQRWRVPIGFIAGALLLVFAEPRPLTLTAGGMIALTGLGLRAWSAGHIRKNEELATTGPYAYTRNPLYLGSFLLGLGFSIASGRAILTLLFMLLFLGIYIPVMRVEAANLGESFRDRYARYANEVPLFFPRLTPYKEEGFPDGTFDKNLYMRYREYRAALGLAIVWGLLALKAAFLK